MTDSATNTKEFPCQGTENPSPYPLATAFRRRLSRIVAGIAGLAMAGLLGGCGMWGPEGGPGGAGIAVPKTGASPTAEAAVDAVVGSDGVQRARVEATDGLKLVPDLVRAHPGTIELTIHNGGVTPHNVIVEGGGRPGTGNLNGGGTTTVRVTVTAPGHYPFPCIYHATSGMLGTLEVTGSPGPG
jgi:plastocyanin